MVALVLLAALLHAAGMGQREALGKGAGWPVGWVVGWFGDAGGFCRLCPSLGPKPSVSWLHTWCPPGGTLHQGLDANWSGCCSEGL